MDAVEGAMACEWWGLKYAIPCHHDNAKLPEIVKFNQILTDARKIDPNAPEPVILEPGETITL